MWSQYPYRTPIYLLKNECNDTGVDIAFNFISVTRRQNGLLVGRVPLKSYNRSAMGDLFNRRTTLITYCIYLYVYVCESIYTVYVNIVSALCYKCCLYCRYSVCVCVCIYTEYSLICSCSSYIYDERRASVYM